MQADIVAFLCTCACRLFAKQTPRKLAARVKARAEAQEGKPVKVGLEITSMARHCHIVVQWLCGHV